MKCIFIDGGIQINIYLQNEYELLSIFSELPPEDETTACINKRSGTYAPHCGRYQIGPTQTVAVLGIQGTLLLCHSTGYVIK
jgi:hypothetical protein